MVSLGLFDGRPGPPEVGGHPGDFVECDAGLGRAFSSPGERFALRIGMGLTEAILFPVCHADVARWFPWSERGCAQSFRFNGATIGAAAGAVAPVLILAASWRAVFLVLAATGLVILVPMPWRRTQDDPRVSEMERQGSGSTSCDRRLARLGRCSELTGIGWEHRLDACAGGPRRGGDGGGHQPHRRQDLEECFGVRCGRGESSSEDMCRHWGQEGRPGFWPVRGSGRRRQHSVREPQLPRLRWARWRGFSIPSSPWSKPLPRH